MSSLGERTVLAIDPGSRKCGIALVERNDFGKITIVWKGIVATESVVEKAESLFEQSSYTLIVIGGGTSSRKTIESIKGAMPSIGVLVIDEKNTTMNARERYWIDNPRKGWRKLLPASMQNPPVDVDDYVAVILAERVLST